MQGVERRPGRRLRLDRQVVRQHRRPRPLDLAAREVRRARRRRRGRRCRYRATLPWDFSSDVCKHCEHAGCLEACPTGSIVRTEFGGVFIQPDICNGCGYCVVACPFGVVDRRPDDGRAFKCTFCYDRQKAGLEPACAKACPTESIQFGDLERLWARAARANRRSCNARGMTDAHVLRPPGDERRRHARDLPLPRARPEEYNLPPAPEVPTVHLEAGVDVGGVDGRTDADRCGPRVSHRFTASRHDVEIALLIPAVAFLRLGAEGLYNAARARTQARPSPVHELRQGGPRLAEPQSLPAVKSTTRVARIAKRADPSKELFLPARPAGAPVNPPAPLVVATRIPGALAVAQPLMKSGAPVSRSVQTMQQAAAAAGISGEIHRWCERASSNDSASRQVLGVVEPAGSERHPSRLQWLAEHRVAALARRSWTRVIGNPGLSDSQEPGSASAGRRGEWRQRVGARAADALRRAGCRGSRATAEEVNSPAPAIGTPAASSVCSGADRGANTD